MVHDAMLILNKILPLFVLPIGTALLLLGLAWWRKKGWLALAGASWLYLCSTPFFADRLNGWLESLNPPVPLAQAPQVEAVMCLGGIFGPAVEEGYLANTGDAFERLEAGIQLVQSGKAKHMILSGAQLPWDIRDKTEGDAAKREALRRGVPAEAIVITDYVGNTADEARTVAALVKERGWGKIILVTSARHMPRAARLFRKAGVDFVPFPVDYQTDVRRPLTLIDFLPQAADGLSKTEWSLRECYGTIFYALTGR